MSDFKVNGTPGDVVMKLQVTRKETGKVEEYEFIGKVINTDTADVNDIGLNTKEKE